MVSICRRYCVFRWLRIIAILLVPALIFHGCSSSGGARVYVGEDCEGLGELGYHSPYTLQDAKDIKSLGYEECANYIKSTLADSE